MVWGDLEPYNYVQEERSLDLLEGDLAAALAYWRSLTSVGRVPSWDEFDLLQLPLTLIPLIHIFDAVDGGRDFRCRFWGSTYTHVTGKEMAGKMVTTLHPSEGFTRSVLREMNTVVSTAEPRSTTSYLKTKNDLFVFQILLRLPLTGKSGEVAHCVTLTEFEPAKDQANKLFQSIT